MKKNIIVCILVFAIILTACTRQEEKNNTEDITTETIKSTNPQCNIIIKDSDGNIRINGDDIKGVNRSTIEFESTNKTNKKYIVEAQFTDDGSVKLKEITSELIGSRLEIYVGDEMVSNPQIKQPVTEGRIQIAVLNSNEEMEELIEKIQGSN